jgi:hypothetical protein
MWGLTVDCLCALNLGDLETNQERVEGGEAGKRNEIEMLVSEESPYG